MSVPVKYRFLFREACSFRLDINLYFSVLVLIINSNIPFESNVL